ncbi:hypothetical protein GCM10011584_23000 [Nocardioides phosphati]|uniref:WD40 repeat domain-containing protein n=1 Tax=Nocardioides phosphati TaxID=1867775 RepID=A0ABQ2NCT1_9ACTN|nr:PD40 domain-containing protein [Nocardioides phosphati]GGO90671.1 hypothetical protein GCM10011584_23000 [Nocardioides phosphati]
MTDALRDELLRMGEAAPPAVVPRDVWDRGRRARRRDRVVAGGAVLSVLVALGGLGVLLAGPGRHEAPPVSSRSEAVPSVIHHVPARLEQLPATGHDVAWDPKLAESDLAIGRASVAFTSGERPLPVVITAADGAYHLLKLPGWVGSNIASGVVEGGPLALSPDGRQLAWGWYDPRTLGTDKKGVVAAGVRVADLETGKVRTVGLSGGHGVAVGTIRWSPDSRWIVWYGAETDVWTEGQAGSTHLVAGRIARGATTSELVGLDRAGSEQLVIDDHGTVSWTTDSGWESVDREGQSTDVTDVMSGVPGTAAAVSPSGRSVALATGQPRQDALFFRWVVRGLGGGSDLVGRIETVPEVLHAKLPADRYPEGATIEPVGWADDDHVVTLVTAAHDVRRSRGGSDWTGGETSLVVMSAPGGARDSSYDVVARLARSDQGDGRITAMSVAVDLLDQPTRDFPAPEWPWSDERKVAVYGGIGVALLAAVVFGLAYRRGRRLL